MAPHVFVGCKGSERPEGVTDIAHAPTNLKSFHTSAAGVLEPLSSEGQSSCLRSQALSITTLLLKHMAIWHTLQLASTAITNGNSGPARASGNRDEQGHRRPHGGLFRPRGLGQESVGLWDCCVSGSQVPPRFPGDGNPRLTCGQLLASQSRVPAC
ncbi:hypothetical protein AAFF_G00113200 [Aldrovandia affinis]|uniref:Uncharacterized protein n=1 Tax=Aldrovandia affinis TaxID=143900 RepID=A0AAD7RT06_9TELE|nr:hypothetical protein AAFF_G00113200 [Aldrovandia affinis]